MLQNRSFVQPRPGGFPPLQFPPFPHKQRAPRPGPEPPRARSEAKPTPLTARTGLYNSAFRERGVKGRVAAAEPPSIRALDSEIPKFLFPQGQPLLLLVLITTCLLYV